MADAIIETHKALLRSGDFSDFTVVCGDKEWKEGQERNITLVDDSPAAVGRMLEYLYTFEFEYSQNAPDGERPNKASLQGLLDILAVYTLADKYDVSGLREYCRSSFKKEVRDWKLELKDLCVLAAEAISSLPCNDKELMEEIVQMCAPVLPRILQVKSSNDQLGVNVHVQQSQKEEEEWSSILHVDPVFTTRILRETVLRYRDNAESAQAASQAAHEAEIEYLFKAHNELLNRVGRMPLSGNWRLHVQHPIWRP